MVYIFDGSEKGFYTAFLSAYHDEYALLSSRQIQLPLGTMPKFVKTDERKAEKARARVGQIDSRALEEIKLLLRSGEEDGEQTAFLYLREIAKAQKPMRGQLQNESVFEAMQKIKRIRHEIHRFHGFIRFMETASGTLYAPFSPDHDICDLLVPHFRARLPKFSFVIHDVKRNKAAVYDGVHCFVAPLKEASVVISASEEGWQALFKKYYQAVNIPSRERLKQMRGYMPVRYQKFMLETQGLPLEKGEE